MKKKAELLKSINAQRKIVLDLLQKGSVDEAKTASDALEQMQNEYDKMPEEVVGAERMVKPMNKNEKMAQVRSAVDSYLHKGWQGVTDEMRNYIKPLNAVSTPGQVEDTSIATKGAALVPVETADFVMTPGGEGSYRLRDLVQNYFTSTKSGKIPMVANPSDTLTNFDELQVGGLHKTDVTISAVNFNCQNYGDLVPVSSQIVEDSVASVYDVIAGVFAKKNRNTENKLIIDAIKSLGSATAIHTAAELVTAINEAEPIDSNSKKIITNTDGGAFLQNLVDDSHYVLMNDQTGPRKYYRGYEIIQLPKSQLSNGLDGSIPFIVGDLYDAVCFVERRGLVISVNPFGDAFAQDGVDVKITARYDAQPKFAGSVKLLAYSPAEEDEEH